MSDFTSTVCAVIVTFNIGRAFERNFQSVKNQVGHVIIIDNGSTDDTLAVITALQLASPAGFVDILLNPENGLAKAQNMGIRKAMDDGYRWVLLLDHDSRPAEGMVKHMGEYYLAQDAATQASIGMLHPLIHDENLGKTLHYLATSRWGWVERRHARTVNQYDESICPFASGSLIPMAVFRQAGLMDESLFIDYIDNEFSLRLRVKKWKIIVLFSCVLYHCIGEMKAHKAGIFEVVTTNNPPSRRYYSYRNKIIVWKRYLTTAFDFVLFDIIRSGYDIFRIALYETEKRKKFRAIGQGIRDGIMGKTGRKPMDS